MLLSAAAFLASASLAAAAVPNVTIGQGAWAVGSAKTGVVCIHMAMLPGTSSPFPGSNPRVVCVERPHNVGKGPYPFNALTGGQNTVEWDPYTTSTTFTEYAKVYHSLTNPFCGGHAQLEDGTWLLAGGDKQNITNPLITLGTLTDGGNGMRRYTQSANLAATGATSPWSSAGPSMAQNRWYPIVTTINTGEVFIAGGVTQALDFTEFNAGKNFNNPTFEWYNSKRTGIAGYPKPLEVLAKTNPLNLYPFTTQLPNGGKLFMFVGNYTILIDPASEAVTDLPTIANTKHKNRIYPYTSTVTMLPLTLANNYTATMLVCGGTLRKEGAPWRVGDDQLTASPWCSSIRPEDPNPAWQEDFVRWDGEGRMMPDSVIMPDARILYVNGAQYGLAGGDSGQVDNGHNPNFSADIYDPVNKTFTKVASFTVARLYHSNALLLPDGRIVTAGSEMANWVDIDKQPNRVLANQCFPGSGANATKNIAGCTDPFETQTEIYTPYYKTLPSPPIIDQSLVPRQLGYGSVFAVGLKTAPKNVSVANIIRYASSTHSTNTDQRYVELPILGRNASHVFLQLPEKNTVVIPGLWMLFLVGNNGAIDVSATVHITNANAKLTVALPSPEPSAARGLRANLGGAGGWTVAVLLGLVATVMML
ncbi:glyoxal oxidase N-terminus-domain-containing protein [Cladochytrium replicatum]|nr:glyoxal oxidase N-terminus-domain-containing protein [Cladochytrium replicatum]